MSSVDPFPEDFVERARQLTGVWDELYAKFTSEATQQEFRHALDAGTAGLKELGELETLTTLEAAREHIVLLLKNANTFLGNVHLEQARELMRETLEANSRVDPRKLADEETLTLATALREKAMGFPDILEASLPLVHIPAYQLVQDTHYALTSFLGQPAELLEPKTLSQGMKLLSGAVVVIASALGAANQAAEWRNDLERPRTSRAVAELRESLHALIDEAEAAGRNQVAVAAATYRAQVEYFENGRQLLRILQDAEG